MAPEQSRPRSSATVLGDFVGAGPANDQVGIHVATALVALHPRSVSICERGSFLGPFTFKSGL